MRPGEEPFGKGCLLTRILPRGAHTVRSVQWQAVPGTARSSPPSPACVALHERGVPTPTLLPAVRAGAYSLPNVIGEALQGHIIQGQMAQAPKLREALWKPVKT